MVAITEFGREQIFDAVKDMYTHVAEQPDTSFHFPTGRGICEILGYPSEQLDAIPPTALESFAGVGYPHRCNVIKQGDVVLDIGAGAGTDAMIASMLTGVGGKVYALDMTKAMHEKLKRNIERAGVENIEPLLGNAEEIPMEDGSVDVVTSNGVLNLVPDKPMVFDEIFRVVKPGGCIQISDIVIQNSSDELDGSRNNPKLWAECIVGALYEQAYINGLQQAGFDDIEVLCHQDYFSHSEYENTRRVTRYYGAESITFTGVKR